jgi:hypothetical protein
MLKGEIPSRNQEGAGSLTSGCEIISKFIDEVSLLRNVRLAYKPQNGCYLEYEACGRQHCRWGTFGGSITLSSSLHGGEGRSGKTNADVRVGAGMPGLSVLCLTFLGSSSSCAQKLTVSIPPYTIHSVSSVDDGAAPLAASPPVCCHRLETVFVSRPPPNRYHAVAPL